MAVRKNIPALPEPGESVKVELDDLPDFLEIHQMQIVSMDQKFLYVKPRDEHKKKVDGE